MQAIKRIITKFLILMTVSLMLLSGCGEFKDIDKMVFVSMIGIDQTNDSKKPYKIILKLYVPTSSFRQSSTPQYSYLIKEGETLAEIISILESHTDKELDFGHSKMIVIGEEMLKNEKNKEILDFLIRRPDIQMISYVGMGRPNAEEILKFVPKGETALQPTLFNYFDNDGAESSYIITSFLFDFRRRLKAEDISPILPIIEIDKPTSHFIVDKSIVLEEDKPPYELDSQKTMLVKMLSGDAKNIFFSVNRENEHFVARLDNIKVNYNLKKGENNNLSLNVKIKLVGIITESKKNLSNKELPRYSKLLEEEMKEEVEQLIHELKNEGYDPIGFGLRYNAYTLPKNRMDSKEWMEAYKNAELKVTAKSSLKSTGSVQ